MAARDDRDERCNYRGGPARDPEVGNETRRTVSGGQTCPGGRKGWARSARRPPTLVAHSIPSTDCTDVPGARPSPVSATLRVDSETKPVTKPPCNIISFLFFLLPRPSRLYNDELQDEEANRRGNDLTFPNSLFSIASGARLFLEYRSRKRKAKDEEKERSIEESVSRNEIDPIPGSESKYTTLLFLWKSLGNRASANSG